MGLYVISVVGPDGEIIPMPSEDVPGAVQGYPTKDEAKEALGHVVRGMVQGFLGTLGQDAAAFQWNDERTSALFENGTTASVVDFSDAATEVTKH